MTKGKLMRDLYDSFLESGIGRDSFCAMHQINVHTFKYWQRKFESADGHLGFVSVVVGSECSSRGFGSEIVVEYPNGVKIKTSASLDYISKLIRLI
jgi:hypothetical protein